ncbi:hypothetical protein EVAR_65786_1 [Eumeta japonica]|uniref:DUF4817 domain-containing protein n=1 Tax=Eumeta variegata TaxID=151549 RepID=A0A4C1ZXW1_EUMVA|nr:hypothetical protein EVAR_65786_1 [Eumeta japonica]
MHLIYGECRCNASAVARLYRERYPNLERYPDRRVFVNVHRSLTEGGHFPNQILAGGRPSFPYEEEVLQRSQMTQVFPFVELKKEEYSKATAHRILQRAKMHPFHVQRVQSLPRDYPERISFCRTMLQRHNENPQFIRKILWSDESTFKKDGYINLHNFHEWHVENPHLMREDRSQYRFKVNLWTGILNDKIIGPFELPENLNGTNYLHFLLENLPTLLEDVPLTDRRHMWYQQDGCPAHSQCK